MRSSFSSDTKRYDKLMIITFIIMLCVILSDIDECESSSDDCHQMAECIDTQGSYSCLCLEGYYGNGRECKSR